MTLGRELARQVEERFGAVAEVRRVSGGSISEAVRIEAAAGTLFLKHGEAAPAGLFRAEAEGLEALRRAPGEIVVPEVLALHDPEEAEGGAGPRWIALEWLEPAPLGPVQAERLGRGLATLHSTVVGEWGWWRGGFIGSLPQPNAGAPDWPTFWWTRRLEPQLRLAGDPHGLGGREEWARLERLLPETLEPGNAAGAALLHGDLWSGNVLPLADGRVALVDPACYRGHSEVDLAMADLFGGFPDSFRAAYAEILPQTPGYHEVRRGVYQLYYLLVHVNIFGGGYVERTARLLRRVLASA